MQMLIDVSSKQFTLQFKGHLIMVPYGNTDIDKHWCR